MFYNLHQLLSMTDLLSVMLTVMAIAEVNEIRIPSSVILRK